MRSLRTNWCWMKPSSHSIVCVSDQQRICILEGQLTWMVYIISSVVRGRPTSSNEVQVQNLSDCLSTSG